MVLDRRTLLKSIASLAAIAGFEGIRQSATAMAWPEKSQPELQPQELQPKGIDNMKTNTNQSISPSWLARQVGFQLAHEQFTVPELVNLGVAAERAGFDLLALSDHLQPWQTNEGHSGQAWITMSAIGQRTPNASVWERPSPAQPFAITLPWWRKGSRP